MYVMGIDPTANDETPKFSLGQLGAQVTSAGTKVFMYCQADASGITGDGYVCVIDGSSFSADMIDTTNSAPDAGQGKPVGVARAAVTASYYCWLQVYGPGVVRVAASANDYDELNSTATAGQLDDDATAGAEVVDGIVLDTANGGAAATAAGWLNWPKVGRTL